MRLTVTTFLSLDGVMQGPGGPTEDRSGGFELGGWLVPYFTEDMGPLVEGWFAAADAFLLGRRTYEIFAAHWPRFPDQDDPVAKALNRLPKHVATTTLRDLDWDGAVVLESDVPTAVAALKEAPGRELQVHGSAGLLQTLIQHDLVDEYRLWVFPVVLGTGKRLFESGVAPRSLSLTSTQTTSSGVAIHTYVPAGPARAGSFMLDDA